MELKLLTSWPQNREIIRDFPGGPKESRGSFSVAEGGRTGAQSDAGTETAPPICSEVEEGPRAGKQGGPWKLDVSPQSLPEQPALPTPQLSPGRLESDFQPPEA